MTAKERFCFNCGVSLGVLDWVDRYESCGEIECDREARHAYAEEQDDRRERAAADNYERY